VVFDLFVEIAIQQGTDRRTGKAIGRETPWLNDPYSSRNCPWWASGCLFKHQL